MSLVLLVVLDIARVAASLLVAQKLWRAERLEPRQVALVIAACLASAPFIFAVSEPFTAFSDFRAAYYAAGKAVLDNPAALRPLIEQVYFVNLHVLAGVMLGFCAIIKPPLVLFGAYFILRRNWSSAAGFVGVGASACILSLGVFGWDLHRLWFELCVWQFSTNPILAFNAQSIPAFLARLTGDLQFLRDWSAHPPSLEQRLAGSLLTLLLYLTAVLACTKGQSQFGGAERVNGNDRGDLEYLLVLSLIVVASPLSWTHYYAWFLIPVAFILSCRSPLVMSSAFSRLAWLGVILLMPAVTHLQLREPLAATLYGKFLVSHVLFGGLLWFVLLAWLCARPPIAGSLPTSGR